MSSSTNRSDNSKLQIPCQTCPSLTETFYQLQVHSMTQSWMRKYCSGWSLSCYAVETDETGIDRGPVSTYISIYVYHYTSKLKLCYVFLYSSPAPSVEKMCKGQLGNPPLRVLSFSASYSYCLLLQWCFTVKAHHELNSH